MGSSARGFRRISKQNEEVKNRNSSQYLDSIQGMSTLKMFNEGDRRGQQMEAGNETQRRLTMRLLAVAQFQFVFHELGFALFSTAVAMGVALYRWSGGFMTPGEVVAVVLLSLEFSRTLLLIGEFFFAGALDGAPGSQPAGKVIGPRLEPALRAAQPGQEPKPARATHDSARLAPTSLPPRRAGLLAGS